MTELAKSFMNSFGITFKNSLQGRKQEFFRTGEVSWNQGTSINVDVKHQKEKPRREKISGFFTWKLLKNCTLNEKFYSQMTTIRAIFLQIAARFSNLRKRARKTSPPFPHPPSYSYAPALSDSIKKSFISGDLSTSQKQAAINLIEMKDKNKRLIKNWRQFLCSIQTLD